MLLWNNVIILMHWRHIFKWKFNQWNSGSTVLSPYKALIVSIMINIAMVEAMSQIWKWTFTIIFQMNLLIMSYYMLTYIWFHSLGVWRNFVHQLSHFIWYYRWMCQAINICNWIVSIISVNLFETILHITITSLF